MVDLSEVAFRHKRSWTLSESDAFTATGKCPEHLGEGLALG